MHLTTGNPEAKTDGDRIVVTVPSGSQSLEIAMTIHQALQLSRATLNAASLRLDTARCEAEVLPMPSRKRRA